ncbi:hypothetical protein CC117_07765 [Parafrankia colletiae]|uniref:Uncharacterized protein n=1 Tax=Parafrankia colletiae TaxID=573497 RepID=A0A1S1Q5P2_9ACTN|nr:hypothetical protein CC117_07765 [Parafrankia colletiae]
MRWVLAGESPASEDPKADDHLRQAPGVDISMIATLSAVPWPAGRPALRLGTIRFDDGGGRSKPVAAVCV